MASRRGPGWRCSIRLLLLVLAPPVLAQDLGQSFDRRASMRRPPTPQQQAAVQRLRAETGRTDIALREGDSGNVSLSSPLGRLSGPQPGDPVAVAERFIEENIEALGLDASDFADRRLTSVVPSAVSGTTHIYFQQMYLGLPVYDGTLNVSVDREGRVKHLTSSFAARAGARHSPSPRIPATAALVAAARHLGYQPEPPRAVATPGGVRQLTRLSSAMARNEVEASLMWLRDPAGLRLVWNLQIETTDGHHHFDINVDAGAELPDEDPDRVVTRFDRVDSLAGGSGGESFAP